jgi:PAS domain S-box-containing protein
VVQDITERKQAESELRRAKAEWERTFDSVPDLIAILDDQHRIVRVNLAMAARLDASPEACTGLSCFACVHGTTGPIATCPHTLTLLDGREHVAEVYEERLGGDFLVSTTPLLDEHGQMMGAVHVARDITAAKRAEEELKKLNRTLKAVSSSSQAILHAFDEQSFLQEACRIVTVDCGYRMVWIGFAEDDDSKTVRPAAWSGKEDGYLSRFKVTWDTSATGVGPTGTAIRTGVASMCRDMRADQVFAPWREAALERGYASSLAIPLMEGEKAIGAITVYSATPDAFIEGEVKLLTELAGDLSFGIRTLRIRAAHARAEAALQESEAKLHGIVSSAMDAVISVNEQQRIVVFNRSAETIFQCPAEEALGSSLDRFIPEALRERHREHVRRFAQDGETARSTNSPAILSAVRTNGEQFPIEATISRLQLGRDALYTVILRDITERKRAEDALRESEERLSLFIEHAPVALAMLDTEMRYVRVSRRWKLDYGLGDRVLRGLTHYEVFPEITERWKALHRRGLAGEVLRADADPFERADGSMQWIRWEIRPWNDSNGMVGGILIFSEDVTDRKLAEDALREQAELLELAHETIMVFNMDGTIRFWNHGAEEIYGFSKEQATGRKAHELLSTVFPLPRQDVIARVAEEGRWEGELAQVTRDGKGIIVESRWALQRDKNGEPSGVMEINSDITKRVQAEQAQREAHLKLQSVLDSITDGLLTMDPRWELTYCSEHGARILGRKMEDIVGASVWDLFPPTGHPIFGSSFRRAAGTGRPVHFEEYAAEPLNTWLECHCYPTKEGLSVYFRDITERKKTEEALLRSDKLASVGRMAATIAHEINNPLAAITNTLFLANMEAEDPTAVRRLLDVADDELKRIAHITRQTLGFYRESTVPIEVSVSAVMESTLDLMKSKIAARQASIKKDWDGETEVTAVAGELRQVFSNLLSNSLDAIDEGGKITVRIRSGPDFKRGGRWVRVTMADNGRGIPAASLPRIFEPFFTTKGTVGTGLGLWVSKQIAEKHGGTVRVRSKTEGSDHGTVFTIFLPMQQPDTEKKKS